MREDDPGATAGSGRRQFGPQLTALMAYLTVVCRLPRRWVHVNGEGTFVAINTGGTDRLTVQSNGNVGVNAATPAQDAILEVNGGNLKGLRIAPRSVHAR